MSEQQVTTSYTLPPQFLQDFLAGGGQGSGVVGLFPLLNQALQNQFANIGTPGATPFTYQGERIAGFSPRELEAFRLSDQAIGSYIPFLNRQTQLTEQGLQRGIGGLDDATRRIRGLSGLQDRGLTEAERLLRSGTGQVLSGTERGLDLSRLGAGRTLAGLGDATSTARGAYGLLGSQLGTSGLTARDALGGAARTALGSTGLFDPRSASAFTNPFEDQVVRQTLRDIREQGSVQDQRRRAQAIASGAFGGARSRLTGQELAEAQREAELDAISRIRFGGFSDALGRAQTAFEQQQRRQSAAADQLGNVAGGLGSLAGAQATAGQNLARQLANYGQAGGLALQNLGRTETGIGQLRGSALGGLGTNIAGLTGQRVGLGQNIAGNLANLGLRGAGLLQGTGSTLGNIGTGLGSLQRRDIGLLGSVGGAQRGMNQAINDLAYQNFVGQYGLPQQLLGQYSGIAQGIAPLAGSIGTTTTQVPGIDYFSSALGGFFNALGNQAGGGISA